MTLLQTTYLKLTMRKKLLPSQLLSQSPNLPLRNLSQLLQ